ncbi:hypothetical protein GGR57DRAFT_512592 [Xylariaceae sp. FL1272]|nr:hypothetical protein GGR57DRAFT_512592 [Xylariaceae sp. FL1272]
MHGHVWSFPSRGGFTRNKSIDDDLIEPHKFSTVFVGQPNPHPTRDVSSAFKDLFGVPRNRRLRSDNPQVIATNENSNPRASVKSYFFNEAQDRPIRDRDATPRNSAIKPVREPSTVVAKDVILSSRHGLYDSTQVSYQNDNGPRMRSFSLSSSESQDAKDQNMFIPLSRILSSDTVDRLQFRSVSSSYPSEGIRSPISSASSPKPVGQTSDVAAEYCRFGKYPSRENWNATEVSLTQVSPVTAILNTHTVEPTGPYEARSTPETWSAGTKNNHRHFIQRIVSHRTPKQIQAETSQSPFVRCNALGTGSMGHSSVGQLSNPIPMTENPFLDPDTGSIARVTPTVVHGSVDNEQSEANFGHTDSAENLYRRATTNETLETCSSPAFQAERRANSDQSNHPTRHSWKKKHSRGYWIELLGLGSSTSPVDASRSVDKSKPSIWMKTMYSRTKAHLDHAVKQGYMRKMARSKAKIVLFKWKQSKEDKKRKASKSKKGTTRTHAQKAKNKKNKKPEKKRRSVSEMFGIKKMQTKAHNPMADILLGVWKKESKINKTDTAHIRVHSCPAAIE